MRKSTLLWSVLCIAVVIGLFAVKHSVQDLEGRLQALNTEILLDRDATQVLEAEWSYLNQPARLEMLGRKLLGMQPASADQILTPKEFRLEIIPVIEERTAITEKGSAKKTVIKSDKKPIAKIAPSKPETSEWLKPILAKMKKGQ
ncbi:MAG: hypothetical protein VX700_13685 [Pseudomonadota bacterium]|nr:hypothetical protein [Pseudomonadota bacterium]